MPVESPVLSEDHLLGAQTLLGTDSLALCSEQAQSKCPGYSVELLLLCMRQPVPAPLCTSVPLHRAPLGWSSPQFHDLISFPHTPSKHKTPKGLPFHHPQKTEQKLSFS